MTTIISRLYKTETTAKRIVSALQEAGIRESDVSLVAVAKATEEGAPAPSASGDVAATGVAPEAVSAYAPKVEGGNALVVVRAPFGMATKARGVLDSAPTVSAGLEREEAYVRDSATGPSRMVRHAAPASGARNIIPGNKKYFTGESEISTADPTPLSSMLGWRTLKEYRNKDLVRRGEDRFIFKSWKRLSDWRLGSDVAAYRDRPTPFSNAIGWKTLKEPKKGAPSVISDDPTPLSSRLGWKTLTN